MSQTQWEQQTYPGKIFYQAVLRSPMADQFLQQDVRSSLLRTLYTLSGQTGPDERFRPARDPGPPPAMPAVRVPDWLSQGDLDFVTAEFQRSGFTGGLNYYRNMDRNWAMTAFLDGAKMLQPTLFIGGDNDPVMEFHGRDVELLEANVPNLRRKVLLKGVGHWTQQEAPDQVNALLLEFLKKSRD